MAWFQNRAKPLILHVDDEYIILSTLKLILESLGLDVIQANTGPDGIKIAAKEKPSLILLDAMMPVMDGYETCIKLKRDPKTKDIPVIMLTGLDTVKDVEQAMAAGANSYLVKPIERNRLKAKLENFIKLSTADEQKKS